MAVVLWIGLLWIIYYLGQVRDALRNINESIRDK